MTSWMSKIRSSGIILAAVVCSAATFGEPRAAPDQDEQGGDPGKTDPWSAYRLLQGTWEARIEGRLGEGSGVRRYEFIYDDKFLVGHHASIRPPQELSPEGDYHRELSVFSFDTERETIVLRQFIVEGLVLQFTCETLPLRITCITEAIENGPGMTARMTIEFRNRFEFSELFELAGPGKELQPYLTLIFTRRPSLEE